MIFAVVQKGEPMDDLISRQEVIKAVTYGALSSATLFGRSDAGMIALRETVRVIKQLPSAQPELTEEERQQVKKLRSFHNGAYAKVLDKLMAYARGRSTTHE